MNLLHYSPKKNIQEYKYWTKEKAEEEYEYWAAWLLCFACVISVYNLSVVRLFYCTALHKKNTEILWFLKEDIGYS